MSKEIVKLVVDEKDGEPRIRAWAWPERFWQPGVQDASQCKSVELLALAVVVLAILLAVHIEPTLKNLFLRLIATAVP